MNPLQNESYYKQKALKYKMKYLFLKQKMFGGAKPAWFDPFNQELRQVYPDGENMVITGSAALAILLNDNGATDDYLLLKRMTNGMHAQGKDMPGDLDLVYTGNIFSRENIRDFKRDPKQSIGTSVTFINDAGNINEIDLTNVPRIEYVIIDGLRIISPQNLLAYYKYEDNPELKEKNKYKIPLLEELISKIQNKYQIHIDDWKKEQRELYRKSQLPSNSAAKSTQSTQSTQPAISTDLSFSDAESPVRPSKPAARKIPLPSLDVNYDNKFESPKRPKAKKSLFNDDD